MLEVKYNDENDARIAGKLKNNNNTNALNNYIKTNNNNTNTKPLNGGGGKRVALGVVNTNITIPTTSNTVNGKYNIGPKQRIPVYTTIKDENNKENEDCPNSDDTVLQDDDEEDEEEQVDKLEPVHEPALLHKVKSNAEALFPIYNDTIYKELQDIELDFSTRPGIFDEDDEDVYDISMVAEYSNDIFIYMRKLELQMKPDPDYMDNQIEIHWSSRSILVNWLVQVHTRFSLLPETLYLTVNYIDRFLSLKIVSLAKFQLVGIVALFLAAKYEEIACPSLADITMMVEYTFSADEIIDAERFMVGLLDYNLGYPGPMSFLRRTSKADDYDIEVRTLAKYLLEITIMDRRFVGSPASWLAAASHYLSRIMLQRTPSWSNAHVYFSGYTKSQLDPAIEVLLECLDNPISHHKSIYEKYCDRKFKRAARFVEEWNRDQQLQQQQQQR